MKSCPAFGNLGKDLFKKSMFKEQLLEAHPPSPFTSCFPHDDTVSQHLLSSSSTTDTQHSLSSSSTNDTLSQHSLSCSVKEQK